MAKRRTSELFVDKYRALYYAGASGDFNLIHTDPVVGKQVGLGGNILHGMCTLGFATKHLLKNRDPAELKFLKVRFAHPVYPLDMLTVISEEEEESATFRVLNQKGVEVLVNGEATFRSR